MSHAIRLRGPWTCQPLDWADASAAPLPAGGTLEMPGDWGRLLGDDFRGRVRFTRQFNLPTGLDAGQRVWLVIDSVHAEADVVLNGSSVGQVCNVPNPPAGRFDITSLLQSRNELVVEVSCPATSPEPGRLGLVKLEIE